MGNGTYEIEFLKKGWGATKFYSVRIFGNEELTVDQRIWKYPEFAMPFWILKERNTMQDGLHFVPICLKVLLRFQLLGHFSVNPGMSVVLNMNTRMMVIIIQIRVIYFIILIYILNHKAKLFL